MMMGADGCSVVWKKEKVALVREPVMTYIIFSIFVYFFNVFIGEIPIFNFTYWFIILSIELVTFFYHLSELKAQTYPRGQWSEKVHELVKPGKACHYSFLPPSKFSRKYCQKKNPKTYIQKLLKLISNKSFQKFQKEKRRITKTIWGKTN